MFTSDTKRLVDTVEARVGPDIVQDNPTACFEVPENTIHPVHRRSIELGGEVGARYAQTVRLQERVVRVGAQGLEGDAQFACSDAVFLEYFALGAGEFGAGNKGVARDLLLVLGNEHFLRQNLEYERTIGRYRSSYTSTLAYLLFVCKTAHSLRQKNYRG